MHLYPKKIIGYVQDETNLRKIFLLNRFFFTIRHWHMDVSRLHGRKRIRLFPFGSVAEILDAVRTYMAIRLYRRGQVRANIYLHNIVYRKFCTVRT